MDTNQDGFLDAQELEAAVTNTVLAMMPERADEQETIRRVVNDLEKRGWTTKKWTTKDGRAIGGLVT